MRILSALNHRDIEEYIKGLDGISAFDSVRDKSSLLAMAAAGGYDLVLVSRELPGGEAADQLLRQLSPKECESRRVAYIYGEYDEGCDSFFSSLIDQEIYDFHVGEAITSKDIQRLLYRPAGKAEAYGYMKSRYESEYFDCSLTGTASGRTAKKGLKQLFRGRCKYNPIDKLVVSLISNQATGKSHTAWNMACCLSGRRYATSLLNIDRGYSANLFFNIDELYYDLLDFTIQNNEYRNIMDKCYRKKQLRIITGRLGDEKELPGEAFSKLIYSIRTRSDITIIDTRTGLSELTRLAVKNSSYDLMIFDCDIMHYHMNMNMLKGLRDDFVPEKTIAVINNTNVKSPGHKFIYNELAASGIPFKGMAFISSCGLLSSNLMHTGQAPYNSEREECRGFVKDMDNLLDRLSAR